MIVSILFIFLLFMIYSHNLQDIDYHEIIIRIILFGVSIKYYYKIENFQVQCYPGSSYTTPDESIESVSKGWCIDDIDSISGGASGDDNSGDDNIASDNTDCIFGVEATPHESAISNSKSWCRDELAYEIINQ